MFSESPSFDIESALETTLVNMGHQRPQTPSRHVGLGVDVAPVSSPMRRTTRLPLEAVENNGQITPRITGGGKGMQSEVEPLSIIKKRTPAATAGPLSPTPVRKPYVKNSPLACASPSRKAHRVPSGELPKSQIPVKTNGQVRDESIHNLSILLKTSRDHVRTFMF